MSNYSLNDFGQFRFSYDDHHVILFLHTLSLSFSLSVSLLSPLSWSNADIKFCNDFSGYTSS